MYCYNLLREPMLQKLFGHLDSVLRKIDSEGGSAWKVGVLKFLSFLAK